MSVEPLPLPRPVPAPPASFGSRVRHFPRPGPPPHSDRPSGALTRAAVRQTGGHGGREGGAREPGRGPPALEQGVEPLRRIAPRSSNQHADESDPVPDPVAEIRGHGHAPSPVAPHSVASLPRHSGVAPLCVRPGPAVLAPTAPPLPPFRPLQSPRSRRRRLRRRPLHSVVDCGPRSVGDVCVRGLPATDLCFRWGRPAFEDPTVTSTL